MSDKKKHDSSRNVGVSVGDHVSIYQRVKKGSYYANYQQDSRQYRVSLKTTNKKEAERRARKIDVELNEGTHRARVETKSLAEARQLYLDQLKVNGRSKKTLGKYSLVMKRVATLAIQLHLTRLGHVNLLFIDKYRIARSKDSRPPSQQTIHDEVTIIRSFINFCLKRKLLPDDPLAGINNPDPKPTEQPWWRWNQVMTILASCSEIIRPPLTMLAYTGMRFGELQHLTWDDIDGKWIRIRAKDGWQPKNKDQRSIPLLPEVEAVLHSLPRTSKWVFTMPLTQQQQVDGKQWTQKRLLERLKVVLRKLGLKGHLHTFRHSFISFAILRKESEAQVRKWVGHVDPEVLKFYMHLHDEDSQEALTRLMKNPITCPDEGGEEKKTA